MASHDRTIRHKIKGPGFSSHFVVKCRTAKLNMCPDQFSSSSNGQLVQQHLPLND